jgi:predicted nucleic acid-binding protein
MGLILDTSALVEMERAGECLDRSFIEKEVLFLPAVVWAEALVGVRLADSAARAARRRARLEAIRSLTGIVPFSAEIAEHYADIFSELHDGGQLIPQNDIAVAATARFLEAEVLLGPGDEKHFRRIAGLQVRVIDSSQL